jgi:pyrimidine-nucleoside phosphorylase
MTVLSGIHPDLDTARCELAKCLDNGRALEVFRRMVIAQGGDPRFIDDTTALPQPGYILEVGAPSCGYVADVNALDIGRIVLQLGGGRTKTDDIIDPAAGIDSLVQQGEHIEKGQPLMRLLAKNKSLAESQFNPALESIILTPGKPGVRKLILDRLS